MTAEHDAPHKQALVVLGMHRSGTSSVAGALCKLGAAPPKTLMPEHPDNPKGYWESLSVVGANEELLASGGSFWSDWRPFETPGPRSAVRRERIDRLAAVIRDEFDDAPLIVLKDPRICRIFPLWRDALDRSGYVALPILPLRHPLEVAASLKRRDGLSIAHGLFVWLRHVLDAEAATRGAPRHILRWSDFIA
ncbi:MAG: sulfotransferase family protein, partial [Brevundimonas sp.]